MEDNKISVSLCPLRLEIPTGYGRLTIVTVAFFGFVKKSNTS